MSPRAFSQNIQEPVGRESVRPITDSNLSKRFRFALIGIFAVLLVSGIVYSIIDKPIVAVYLTTGDVYFGRLSHVPGFKLTDPWFIERNKDGGFALRKFTDAVWHPSNVIDISSDHVVFWNKLPSDSPIVLTMEGKAPVGQQGSQNSLPENNANPQDSSDVNKPDNQATTPQAPNQPSKKSLDKKSANTKTQPSTNGATE